MKLISDFTDYYDEIFESEGKQYLRYRSEALNKWQALDYLYNGLQEEVPRFGLPDSLIEDKLDPEQQVYVYLDIHKRVKDKTKPKVLVKLKDTENYLNKLCVEYIEGKPIKLLKVGNRLIWLSDCIGIPFASSDNYMSKYPICCIHIIQKEDKCFIAVDFDSCPILSDVFSSYDVSLWPKKEVIKQYLSDYFGETLKCLT